MALGHRALTRARRLHGSFWLPQTPEFNLKKPSAYNYDFALLGVMTAAFGLIGLPPINGVLPQVRC